MGGTVADRVSKMRIRLCLATAMALASAGLVAAAPAGAVVVKTDSGKRFSYMPLSGQGTSTPPAGTDAITNLEYHGGPVMPAMHQHAIYWAPAGFSFPAGYKAAIDKYLADLAADSGKATNTTSVGTQYTDLTPARAGYSVTFANSFDDTNAYPADGCTPYAGFVGPPFARCLIDAQLRAELNSFITSNGLPRGLSEIYFIVLPDTVGSCFNAAATSCFDKSGGFCAYHTHTVASGTETIYANESFTPRDPTHCGNANYPNGNANGNVDDQLSSLSHEANEAREDPLLNAWYNDTGGKEGADQCRNSGNDYGPLLGGTFGIDGFNQVINGAHYILQMDWSNAISACEQRYGLTGNATGDTSGRAGDVLSFQATGSDTDGGTVTAISWNFGDGTTGNGASVTHSYSAPGTYHPVATISNNTGLSTTAAPPTVTITAPPNNFSFGPLKRNKRKGTAQLPVTTHAPGALKLRGKGINAAGKNVGAGTAKLTVKATGKAARRLRRRGHVDVTAKVTFTPTGGQPRTKRKGIRLVLK